MHVSGRSQSSSAAGVSVNADPLWLRILLIGTAVLITVVLIFVPLVYVFVQAFSGGVSAWWAELTADPDTRHAMLLTLSVVPVAVVGNTIFGIAAAWTLTRFEFRGRLLLLTLLLRRAGVAVGAVATGSAQASTACNGAWRTSSNCRPSRADPSARQFGLSFYSPSVMLAAFVLS